MTIMSTSFAYSSSHGRETQKDTLRLKKYIYTNVSVNANYSAITELSTEAVNNILTSITMQVI